MAAGLRAVLLNCTLKRSPSISNTQALMDHVIEHYDALSVTSESVRVVDHDVRFGISNDEGDGDDYRDTANCAWWTWSRRCRSEPLRCYYAMARIEARQHGHSSRSRL